MSPLALLTALLVATPAPTSVTPVAPVTTTTASAPSPPDGGGQDTERAATLVDLNSASVAELCTLPGIGPKKAEAVVAARTRRPFVRVTQLLQVKGIGPKLLSRIKRLVTVRPVPVADPHQPASTKVSEGEQPQRRQAGGVRP